LVLAVQARSGAATVEEAPSRLDSLMARANALPGRLSRISDSMATIIAKVGSYPTAMPTDGWLSSRYAHRRLHPILNRTMPHEGIDVAAPLGTPILATGAGTVISVGRRSGYGLLVEIDHGDGIVTRYAHCSSVNVRVGAKVTRGTRIAAVGRSGLSTGPHLHYEVLLNGEAMDPLIFISN
jgi:murein DD-endopeptidase MepM/ murein hydrolase activator NlpD